MRAASRTIVNILTKKFADIIRNLKLVGRHQLNAENDFTKFPICVMREKFSLTLKIIIKIQKITKY